jgi:peptide/nickel transport system permease protein
MEPLSWTGSLGTLINPLFALAFAVAAALIIARFVLSFFASAGTATIQMVDAATLTKTPIDTTLDRTAGPLKWALFLLLGLLIVYVMAGIFTPYGTAGIIGEIGQRLLPVWIALIVTFALSITFKRRLGLYGKLFDSPIGMVGFAMLMFWVFAALFGDMIATHDSLSQVSGMKNKLPGTPLRGAEDGDFPHYLLGGDNLARDVFSRVILGSRAVLSIAPAATLFAFMIGITLGLPAGYRGGKFDTVLSFVANLVLAFPTILLFFLLVTPEIRSAGIDLGFFKLTVPTMMAAVLFIFPLIFLAILTQSRFFTEPAKRNLMIAALVIIGGYLYLGLAWDADPFGLVGMQANVLIVFVSVAFVNAPTVFRIVRGLVLDIKTRDYVAAAQTRGEGKWYIMLWEILPNARGPLIVDFCLRIGYTTILLGTLGFFGLGLESESPDWGTTINAGRRLLGIYPHPALAPAIALMSLVLGLNLLADGLREESLKD